MIEIKKFTATDEEFKEGARISGVFKGARDADFEKTYREMVELGIVNQQLQIGDMKNLFKTAKFGEDIGNTDAVLRPMMNAIKSVPRWLQGKYVAEDDFWKVVNWNLERNRYEGIVGNLGINKNNYFNQNSYNAKIK